MTSGCAQGSRLSELRAGSQVSDNHAQVPTVFRVILEAVKAFTERDRGCPMGTGKGRDEK